VNTESNAVPASQLHSKETVSAVIPVTRQMYWLLRRELWENRSIYVAPLAVAAVILFGFLISTVHLPGKLRAASLDVMKHHHLIAKPYSMAALLIMATMFIVGFVYCLDALHGERRDRSILFWKSLPVSDLATVLSKASIPIIVLPLLAFAITIVTQWIMLLIQTVITLGSGLSVGTLWRQVGFFQMSLMLLYHLVVIHGLWYAPIYGWLLLVSAWARRAAILWATLPLLAIGAVEKIAFNTTHFAAYMGYRLSGASAGAAVTASSTSMDPMVHRTLGLFLVSPGMWFGFAVTAVFLAAAVRLRRYRGPI
jgi:ABC-2 type transport system permease protein